MDIVPDPPGTWNFNEVYLYEELMEADLHAIVRGRIPEPRRRLMSCSKIRSGQPLSDAHFQSFLYQTLCGLKVSVSVPGRFGISLMGQYYVAVHSLSQRIAP